MGLFFGIIFPVTFVIFDGKMTFLPSTFIFFCPKNDVFPLEEVFFSQYHKKKIADRYNLISGMGEESETAFW